MIATVLQNNGITWHILLPDTTVHFTIIKACIAHYTNRYSMC